MATKHLDHGAYIPDVTFTASFATSVMTITVAGATKVCVGMNIVAAGLPDNTVIASLGTGTGGTGTYNLSTTPGTLSARSCTGNGGGISAIPFTFGSPQDGDGVGKNPSTASATVSIDLTGATAAAGATINVAGATLTCVASGATVAQFNAGTGATLAANIAAAINRTTNTATITAPATGWFLLPIYVACYAQVTGNVLQIMFRAGSATHNGLQVVTSSFTGGTFGPYTFAGGVSGCWGLLTGAAAQGIGATAIASSMGVLGAPLAGVVGPDDLIYARSGKLIVVNNSNTSTPTSTIVSTATVSNPATLVFTTNEVWTSDDPNGKFEIRVTGAGTNTFGTRISYLNTKSQKFSDTEYGFSIVNYSTTGGIVILEMGGVFDGLCLKGYSAAVTGQNAVNASRSGAAGYKTLLRNFYIQHSSSSSQYFSTANTTAGVFEVVDGIIDALGTATANTAGTTYSSGTGGNRVKFQNVRFTNFVIGSRLFRTGSGYATSCSFIDCDFGNISFRGPYLSTFGTGAATDDFYATVGYSANTLRDFFVDYTKGFCQWNSVYAQPTLNATLDDGVTHWSMVVTPATGTNYITKYSPYNSPRFSTINSLPTGDRTVTVEVAISDTLSWTKGQVSLVVTYKAADGSYVTMDSFDEASGALTVSASTWSMESGGKVMYIDSGTLLHNKYKLQVSTPVGKQMPEGAEVTATVRIHTTVANSTQYVFIDPEVQIA